MSYPRRNTTQSFYCLEFGHAFVDVFNGFVNVYHSTFMYSLVPGPPNFIED